MPEYGGAARIPAPGIKGRPAWVLCRALRRAAALKLATWARNWTRRVDGVSNTVHPLGGYKPCDRDSADQIRPTAASGASTALRLIWHPGAPARLLLPAPAAAATVPANVPSGAHGGCSDRSNRIRGRCLVPRLGNAVSIRGSGSKRVSVPFKIGSRPGLRKVAAPLLADLIGIKRLLIAD